MSMDECSKNISNVRNTWEEIMNEVKVTPTMVFSVIGDSDSFVPRPWPTTVFQTALIEAAKCGGETWILYSGSEQWVSKAVRDAYLKYGNREFGTKNLKRLKDDTNRHIKLISITDTKKKGNPIETVVQCSCENEGLDSFLLEFEKFVSEQEVSFFSQRNDFRMPIPIAIIVCEGDVQTVAHTAEALQHRLPVIIMKGSGKAADLILVYLERSDELRKEAGILFGMKFEDTLFSLLKKYLEIIRENKDLVGVFDLNFDDPLKLSSIIGETVVSCWSVEKNLTANKQEVEKDTTQIPQETTSEETINSDVLKDSLAMTSSSITMQQLKKNSMKLEKITIKKLIESYKKQPRRDVLDPSFTSPTSLPLYFYFGFQLLQESNQWEECGHILLLEALKENRCDYVRVLLDRGVKLTKKNLPELYAQTVTCETCKFKKHDCFHMQWILKQILPPEAETLCYKYAHAMKRIQRKESSSDKYEDIIKNLKYDPNKSVAASAKRLCCKILQYKALNIEEQNTNEEAMNTSDTSDILLWAIFANRKEIAEICWLRGTDHILSGLICSVLLHKLSKRALRVKEHCLSEDLEEHAKLFEQRCIKIMDGMYREDTKHAAKAMDDEAVIWGVQTSPLTIAYENFMYEIVAHTCSRKNMNRKWYNKLPPNLIQFFKSAFQKKKQFVTAPLTKYIFNYLKDLLRFLLIAFFVVLGVGIYYHANQYPDYQNFWSGGWTEWRIWDLIYYPYWQIYAEINLEYLQAEEPISPGSNNIPPQKDWSVVAVAAAYLLFAHLLLVNLVIAMFSYTFERVQKNSEKLWWYERYTAINDYSWRIPSPINLICTPCRISRKCKGITCCTQDKKKIWSNDGENEDRQTVTTKEYRTELQRMIACSIYNKI
ncbi:transient receptor potential cation channel subfamily M member 2-like isoform X5 [Crassostrea virginica]